jgi:hypothetical protein
MSSMLAAVTTYALGFIWIGIGTFLASWGSIAIFMMVGERQTRAIRQNYLRAILRQVCYEFVCERSDCSTHRLKGETDGCHRFF